MKLIYFLALLCLSYSSHTVTFQRFEFSKNRTLINEAEISLHIEAGTIATRSCYELFFDTHADQIGLCMTMSSHTVRDHLIAVVHAVADSFTTTSDVDVIGNSDVTSLALQYVYENGGSLQSGPVNRVCVVGCPSLVDFTIILNSASIGEIRLFLPKQSKYVFEEFFRKSFVDMATAVGKAVNVFYGEAAVIIASHREMFGSRPCDVLHLEQTGSWGDHPALNWRALVQAAASGAAQISDEPLRVVHVRSFSLAEQVALHPPVTLGHSRFIPYNTTAGMQPTSIRSMNTAEQRFPCSVGEDVCAVDWRLWSVWVNESRLHAISNYDGFTGRTFSITPAAAYEHETGKVVMREVMVGQVGVSSDSSIGQAGVPPDSLIEQVSASSDSLIRQTPNNRSNSYHKSAVVIAITYTIRVFGETALGLQAALRRAGYSTVHVVPDMTLDAAAFLHSEGSVVLQIALGPHDFTMLMPNYLVFQMEQVWSSIAFAGLYRLRYGLVLSNALCILSYSPLHTQLLQDLGYPCVREVPLYSALALDDVTAAGELPYKYDFIFFGGCSARRAQLLSALQRDLPLCPQPLDDDDSFKSNIDDEGRSSVQDRDCFRYVLSCVSWQTGVFDAMRHRNVLSSRLVLNIHTDEHSVLEAHRINYLLSLGRCVVSERSDDLVLDARYAAGLRFVGSEPGDMQTTVRALLSNATALKECEVAARSLFLQLSADTVQLELAVEEAVLLASNN